MSDEQTGAIADELEAIRLKGGGILRPIEVVRFAKKKKTALHARFEWDDTAAAHQYRLEQARLIIRCTVRIVGGGKPAVHAYVSITSDRQSGDSYRALVDVMDDDELREQLLVQALKDADSWRTRYERFAELAPIVEAITNVQRTKRRSTRKAAVTVAVAVG